MPLWRCRSVDHCTRHWHRCHHAVQSWQLDTARSRLRGQLLTATTTKMDTIRVTDSPLYESLIHTICSARYYRKSRAGKKFRESGDGSHPPGFSGRAKEGGLKESPRTWRNVCTLDMYFGSKVMPTYITLKQTWPQYTLKVKFNRLLDSQRLYLHLYCFLRVFNFLHI